MGEYNVEPMAGQFNYTILIYFFWILNINRQNWMWKRKWNAPHENGSQSTVLLWILMNKQFQYWFFFLFHWIMNIKNVCSSSLKIVPRLKPLEIDYQIKKTLESWFLHKHCGRLGAYGNMTKILKIFFEISKKKSPTDNNTVLKSHTFNNKIHQIRARLSNIFFVYSFDQFPILIATNLIAKW